MVRDGLQRKPWKKEEEMELYHEAEEQTEQKQG